MLGVDVYTTVLTEGGDYMAISCVLTEEKRPGQTETPYALLGLSLASPTPRTPYVLVPNGEMVDAVSALAVFGYELALCCEDDEVRIVDIRRDHTSNHIQTLTRSGAVDDDTHFFDAAALNATFVAAGCSDTYDVVVVWDRATGQCIRELDDTILRGLVGRRLVVHSFVDGSRYSIDLHDLALVPTNDGVPIIEIEDGKGVSRFSKGDLFVFHPAQGAGEGRFSDSLTVYSLESGDKIREVTLSAPVCGWEINCARLLGDFAILQVSRDHRRDGLALNTFRCVDLHTGEVRTLRLGPSENFAGVHISADSRRILAFRGSPGHGGTLQYVLYTL